MVFHEEIEAGLDRAPAALAAIYRGENRGKKIIQIVGRALRSSSSPVSRNSSRVVEWQAVSFRPMSPAGQEKLR